MALPPPHRVDHTPVVILRVDTAWDRGRIDYELEAIRDPSKIDDRGRPAWTKTEDHPWIRYHSGGTRFDLSTISEYLRGDGKPVKFILRRLPLHQWMTIRDLLGRGSDSAATVFAIRNGLLSIEGLELHLRDTDDGPLSEAGIKALRARIGDSAFDQLGFACINVSRELLDTEKKP